MRTAGIISEYNPFHRGHAWQIGELRRRLGAETAVVCAMSGSFVQRGDFAVMRTHARAEAAVRGGADLVLELPLPWAIASAEGFAAGGVGVLAATGAVDTLVFGSECGDTETLKAVAAALESESFAAYLRQGLQEGVSFAAAREAAARKLLGEKAAVLAQPNDILGVEYCKALLRQHSALVPLALPRRGAAHDAPLDAAPGRYASASALRALVRAGGAAALAPHVPPACLRLYMQAEAEGDILDGRAFGIAVLSRLRAMDAPCGARPRAWRTGSPPPFRAQARWTSWCRPCGQNDMRRRVCAVWCWTRPWDTPGICLHCRPICMCWEQMKRALRYCAAHVRRLCCRCLIHWRIWRPEAPRLRAWQRPMPRPRT